MFSRLVSPEYKSFSPVPVKRNVLLSFGVSNNQQGNPRPKSPSNAVDDTDADLSESPNNQIQSILQRHHFTSNKNNINYLNSNHLTNSNEDLQALESELKYYQELNETAARNLIWLQKKEETLINSTKKRGNNNNSTEFLGKFNPFIRKDQEQREKGQLIARINELDGDLMDWKQKCEALEKEHTVEMGELRGLMKSSQPIVNENESTNNQDLVSMNERLDVLIRENEKINGLIMQIRQEIIGITQRNPVLRDRNEYYLRNLRRFEENCGSNEQNLLNAVKNMENEVRTLRESMKNSRIDMIDSMTMNNSSMIVPPEKRLEFLDGENKKLESEIENWRIQYWNLEKKVKKNELEMKPDLKYTEMDLQEILNKVNRQYSQTRNELMSKMNVLEVEINNLSRRNGENKGNLKVFTSPEKANNLNNLRTLGNPLLNTTSDKKDKVGMTGGVFTTLKYKGNGLSDKKNNAGKVAVFSTSMGNENQLGGGMNNNNNNTAKKESRNNGNALSYTEKILRRMKK